MLPQRFVKLVPACALLVLLAAGCSGNKFVVEIDDKFSYNVAKPPSGYFTNPKAKWTPAESEVLARMGPPDFIHFWWKPDGTLIRSSDLVSKGQDKLNDMMGEAKKTWVYVNDDQEVFFKGSGYSVKPLGGLTKLVCLNGDPSERKPAVMRNGHKYETWQWIEHGIQIELMDDQEVKRSYFTPSGTGTYLGK